MIRICTFHEQHVEAERQIDSMPFKTFTIQFNHKVHVGPAPVPSITCRTHEISIFISANYRLDEIY